MKVQLFTTKNTVFCLKIRIPGVFNRTMAIFEHATSYSTCFGSQRNDQ